MRRLSLLLLCCLLLSALLAGCARPAGPNAAAELPARPDTEEHTPARPEPVSFPLMSVEEAEQLYSLEGCFSSLGLLWEGRQYTPFAANDPVLSNALPDTALLGAYLGDPVWPPKGGEGELLVLPASAPDPCYSVRGYDPSFLLCQRSGSGRTQWLMSLGGRTLRRGAELFEELLHWSEAVSFHWQTAELWPSASLKGRELKEELMEEAKALLDELGDCPFVTKETAMEELGAQDESALTRLRRVRLYLTMPDGMTFLLLLYEGGYLCLDAGAGHTAWLRGGEAVESLLGLLCCDNGTEIAWQERPALRWEDLRADPRFGSFLPEELPEGLLFRQGGISYEIERETGALGLAKSLNAEFSAEDGRLTGAVGLWPASAYGRESGYAGPYCTAEELSYEAVEAAIRRETPSGRPTEPRFDLAVFYGDTMLHLSAEGLEAEDILALLSGGAD